jgi:hypothetical protein
LRFLARLIILLDPDPVVELEEVPELLAPALELLPGLTPRTVVSGAASLGAGALGVATTAGLEVEELEVVMEERIGVAVPGDVAKEGVPLAPHCQLGITV